MWRLKIEQYFQIQDYALWDVIENGNSFKPTARTTVNADGTSTSMISGPATTEEKAQKKNDVKARSMLLMLAILGENISQEDLNLKFLRILPSEWNTHVVVWRNKPDLETISFDDLYNNFKIVEQEVKRIVSTDSTLDSTANLSDATVYAFLANQPNGSQLVHEDLEQIHEDDLEEMDLKWHLALLSMRARKYYQRTRKKITINGSDTAGYDKSKVECFNCHKMGHFAKECREEVTTNMALIAFSDSEVYNDKTCSNTYLKSSEALKTQLDNLRVEFNKSEFNLATYKRGLTSIEEQLVFYKKNEVMFCDQIDVLKRDALFKDSEINALKIEIEKLKNEKESNQIKINKFENASKSLDKLIGSQISNIGRKGVGYNVVPPPPTGLFAPSIIDLSYSGLEEFQQPEFESYGPKASKSVCVDTFNKVKKTSDTPLVEELVLKKEKQTLGSDFVMYNKACFVCRSFDHIQAHCKYHQRERMVYGNNYNSVNYNYTTNRTHPNAQRNMVPRAVLMKTGLKSFNTARTVNTAHPKSTVYSAKPMSCFSKSAQSTVKRPYQLKTVLTNKNFSQKVNTAKVKVNTVRPKAVNTARLNSAVVNTIRDNQANAVKASTC
ncbi:ribonuclease H-like domain-containing protein [Tanacetum coccineum]